MTLDGVRGKTLMSDAGPCGVAVSWSPDGRFLLVNTTSKGPYVVNVDSAEAWPLHESMTSQDWYAWTWSPDGSFVTLAYSTTRLERLAWDGVTYEAVSRLLSAPPRSGSRR